MSATNLSEDLGLQVPECSVVIPVFNCAQRIINQAQIVNDFFVQLNCSYELVLVDDASSDNTAAMLNEISIRFNNVTIIQNTFNRGQTISTILGVAAARGKLVVTIDDDFDNQLSFISTMMLAAQNNQVELIYGIYENEVYSASRFYKKAMKFLLLPYFLTYEVSSFRCIKRSLIQCYGAETVVGRFWKIPPKKIATIAVGKRTKTKGRHRIMNYLKHQIFVLDAVFLRLWLITTMVYLFAPTLCLAITAFLFFIFWLITFIVIIRLQ